MYYYNPENRQFFFPFLVGAVAGGAAIGLTRPRPIVNAYPNYYQPQPYYPMGYNYGYNYYYRPY